MSNVNSIILLRYDCKSQKYLNSQFNLTSPSPDSIYDTIFTKNTVLNIISYICPFKITFLNTYFDTLHVYSLLLILLQKKNNHTWPCQKIYSDYDDTCMCQFRCFLHRLKYFELIHRTIDNSLTKIVSFCLLPASCVL